MAKNLIDSIELPVGSEPIIKQQNTSIFAGSTAVSLKSFAEPFDVNYPAEPHLSSPLLNVIDLLNATKPDDVAPTRLFNLLFGAVHRLAHYEQSKRQGLSMLFLYSQPFVLVGTVISESMPSINHFLLAKEKPYEPGEDDSE